jgi:hypothetical protein
MVGLAVSIVTESALEVVDVLEIVERAVMELLPSVRAEVVHSQTPVLVAAKHVLPVATPATNS